MNKFHVRFVGRKDGEEQVTEFDFPALGIEHARERARQALDEAGKVYPDVEVVAYDVRAVPYLKRGRQA